MDNTIWIAFITGLTTGGISCMLVQSGLVTGSLARQIETGLQNPSLTGVSPTLAPRRLAQPILLFLVAKLFAYTLLGALLGLLGSFLSLNPISRGILQLSIAIFLIGNALRLLNVHPLFRYFSFEPPSTVTRLIRRASRKLSSNLTPLLLGALTVLIPCGVTQSMMAVAITTGSPFSGALIMAAFTLGASPVFFAVAYLATRLSALAETYFTRIVAVVLLLMGLLAFDSGLNLVGSPFSLTQAVAGLLQPPPVSAAFASTPSPAPVVSSAAGRTAPSAGSPVVIVLHVTNDGYSPRLLLAPAGKPVTLRLVSDNTHTCARAFVIPSLNLSAVLPDTGEETLSIPPQPAGSDLHFACSEGLYTGLIHFQ